MQLSEVITGLKWPRRLSPILPIFLVIDKADRAVFMIQVLLESNPRLSGCTSARGGRIYFLADQEDSYDRTQGRGRHGRVALVRSLSTFSAAVLVGMSQPCQSLSRADV